MLASCQANLLFTHSSYSLIIVIYSNYSLITIAFDVVLIGNGRRSNHAYQGIVVVFVTCDNTTQTPSKSPETILASLKHDCEEEWIVFHQLRCNSRPRKSPGVKNINRKQKNNNRWKPTEHPVFDFIRGYEEIFCVIQTDLHGVETIIQYSERWLRNHICKMIAIHQPGAIRDGRDSRLIKKVWSFNRPFLRPILTLLMWLADSGLLTPSPFFATTLIS